VSSSNGNGRHHGNGNPPAQPTILQTMTDIVQSGIIADLSGTQAKVLVVLASYADYATCEAYPSSLTIAKRLGIERNTSRVTEALTDLEKLGILVVVKRGGGTRNPTIRRVVCPRRTPPKSSVVQTPPKNGGDNTADFVERTPPISVQNTADFCAQTPPKNGGGTPHRTPINTSSETAAASGGAAAAGVVGGVGGEKDGGKDPRIAACLAFLKERNIGEPKRSEILGIPGLTAEALHWCWWQTSRGRGAGLFIKTILTDAPDWIAKAQADADEKAAESKEDAEAKEYRAKIEALSKELVPRFQDYMRGECNRWLDELDGWDYEHVPAHAVNLELVRRFGPLKGTGDPRSFMNKDARIVLLHQIISAPGAPTAKSIRADEKNRLDAIADRVATMPKTFGGICANGKPAGRIGFS
jgi:hypothetical protein